MACDICGQRFVGEIGHGAPCHGHENLTQAQRRGRMMREARRQRLVALLDFERQHGRITQEDLDALVAHRGNAD